jgi:hypothetical protein
MTESVSETREPDRSPLPAYGMSVKTACGGTTTFGPKTPWAVYRGKLIFFCLPDCRADFERNPETSCLAARLDEFAK